MKQHGRSELLSLLNSNKAWVLPPWQHFDRTTVSVPYAQKVREAVQCVKEVSDSDPFAAGRTASHLRQGLCLASEVIKDCKERRVQRANEKGEKVFQRGAAGLAAIKARGEEKKRKGDAERAWNQHNSAMFIADKASRRAA